MKRKPKSEDPVALIARGLDGFVTWVPALIVISVFCFAGMVLFAALWLKSR